MPAIAFPRRVRAQPPHLDSKVAVTSWSRVDRELLRARARTEFLTGRTLAKLRDLVGRCLLYAADIVEELLRSLRSDTISAMV